IAMSSDTLMNATEYAFSLTGTLPSLDAQELPTNGAVYRMIEMHPYWSAYFITVSVRENTGELRFGVEQDRESIEQRNSNWAWYRQVLDAYKSNLQPPDQLPESYKFFMENKALSETQVAWFQAKMRALNLHDFVDCGRAAERDGDHRRGQI